MQKSIGQAMLFCTYVPLRSGRKTRYGWLARPYPAGTFTPQEAPSFLGARTLMQKCTAAYQCSSASTCLQAHQKLNHQFVDLFGCFLLDPVAGPRQQDFLGQIGDGLFQVFKLALHHGDDIVRLPG